jgi:hypothetical protein
MQWLLNQKADFKILLLPYLFSNILTAWRIFKMKNIFSKLSNTVKRIKNTFEVCLKPYITICVSQIKPKSRLQNIIAAWAPYIVKYFDSVHNLKKIFYQSCQIRLNAAKTH